MSNDDGLEEVDGIGATYADRLRDSGFGTLSALADSGPEEVADAADASEAKAEDWVEQAAELVGVKDNGEEGGEDEEDDGASREDGGDDAGEPEEGAEEETEGGDEGTETVENDAEPDENGASEDETDRDDEGDEAEEESEEGTAEGGEGADDEEGSADEDASEDGDGAEGGKEDETEDEDDEDKTTKDKLAELGFFDNDFTEFPPELSGLKRFKAEKKPEPIIEALRIQGYDTTFMRLEMVEALGRIGDDSAVDVLLDEMSNNDTRIEAMDALGRIGSEEATERILGLLDPERKVQPHVRAKAAETAGRIGDPEAVELLAETLGSDSSRVRGTAAEALARIGAESEEADVVGELTSVLEEGADETVRMSAARALRSLGTEEARETLAEYEDDRNELVAEAADSVS